MDRITSAYSNQRTRIVTLILVVTFAVVSCANTKEKARNVDQPNDILGEWEVKGYDAGRHTYSGTEHAHFAPELSEFTLEVVPPDGVKMTNRRYMFDDDGWEAASFVTLSASRRVYVARLLNKSHDGNFCVEEECLLGVIGMSHHGSDEDELDLKHMVFLRLLENVDEQRDWCDEPGECLQIVVFCYPDAGPGADSCTLELPLNDAKNFEAGGSGIIKSIRHRGSGHAHPGGG